MHELKYKTLHKDKKVISKAYSLSNGNKQLYYLPYTSLKDKKGKEIYEYDIVKISTDIGNVKAGYYMVVNHQGCYMITRDSHLNYMEHYLWFVTDHCEVEKNFLQDKEELHKLQIRMMFPTHTKSLHRKKK